ncbi:hypothetical protein [Nocardia sp. NBC_01388]|uniref:hypothetical protein n=1 Tax=Nocardia sp. NBC_01388 TaxID=2903596 RepID=UPI002F91BE8F
MAVEVISRKLMLSDTTTHQARYVGDEKWELSCLPGRQVTCEQAAATIRAAEEVAALLVWLKSRALELGLTERELVGFVTTRECDWPRPPAPATTNARDRFGRRWLAGGGAV